MFSLGFGASVAVLKNLEDKENTKGGHEGMFGMFWYVLSFVNVLIFGTKDLFCIQDMVGRRKFITDVGHSKLQSYQLLKCLSSSMSPSWLPCVRTRCRSLLQKMLQPWLPESFNSPWLYMFNPCIQLAPGWVPSKHFEILPGTNVIKDVSWVRALCCLWMGYLGPWFQGWNGETTGASTNIGMRWTIRPFVASVGPPRQVSQAVWTSMERKRDDVHWFDPERAWQVEIIGLSCSEELA